MRWEVRTMRSATSCSKTLIRSDWRRFWPVTFFYAFLSFFALPVGLWNTGAYSYYSGEYATAAAEAVARAWPKAELVYESLPGFAIVNLFLGVVLAMVLFGYLMKPGSVGLMHALPITRTRQFLTHFAAGFSMLTAANVLTVVLSLLAEALLGTVDAVPLLIWLLCVELMGFFFLAFGTLCAMATGWLLAVPVIYFGLNFLVMAYHWLFAAMAAMFMRGLDTARFRYGLGVEWLTPVVNLTDVLDPDDFTMEAYQKGATLFTVNKAALPALLIYAAVGVLMLVLAWLLYRARHSETAGDAIVFPWLRPVVRYVIAGAGGLGLGIVVYQIFQIRATRESMPALVACQMVMGALVYLAVEMLLRKSYKIFDKRTLLGLAGLWLALIAVGVCIKTDAFRVERRVPAETQVETVSFNVAYQDRLETDDPAVIRGVIALHRALVESDRPDEGSGYYFNVTYRLKNGTTLERGYSMDIHDPAVRKALTELMNLAPLRQNALLPDYGKWGTTFTGGYATNMQDDHQVILSEEQCLALYRALEEDMENPRTPEDLVKEGFACQLELNTTEGTYVVWQLNESCTHTLALMKEYGIVFTRMEDKR